MSLDTLSMLGIGLGRAVPKSRDFTAWIQSEKRRGQKAAGIVEFVDALYRATPQTFTWPLAAQAIAELSRQEYEPTAHEVRRAYRDHGGELWDEIEVRRLRRLSRAVNVQSPQWGED